MPTATLTPRQIIDAYARFTTEGASLHDLARRHGVSTETIRQTLIACGCTMRSRGYRTPKEPTSA
ncbi:hypothetical protein GCM10009557_06090 [Virgisporangium ochraceum]|uniref:Uncharacterized protein n=1 Tax=Virgisporangium ochraceum TaxID=65505 RepID=A0A8J4E909_9ACTN|nr:hypothetical protein [Virgisporangium ochraceum]GIJ66266.1 hypothetical protein Voc01_011830 [Virgisporangium ochraceum]